MAKFKGVVKLTEDQLNTLKKDGSITVGGQTINYDASNTLYCTKDKLELNEGGGQAINISSPDGTFTDDEYNLLTASFDNYINYNNGEIIFKYAGSWNNDLYYVCVGAPGFGYANMQFSVIYETVSTTTKRHVYQTKNMQYLLTIDTEMSNTSENPVQNKVIKKYVDDNSSNGAEFITLTTTSGTLTDEQLATLQKSDENYIIYNNNIFRLKSYDIDSNNIRTVLYYSNFTEVNQYNAIYSEDTVTVTISNKNYNIKGISLLKNPFSQIGDMVYKSNTGYNATRLPIGTDGQVLTVKNNIPSWQDAQGGGVEFITLTSTSGTLTQEQYDTLMKNPANGIICEDYIYTKESETSATIYYNNNSPDYWTNYPNNTKAFHKYFRINKSDLTYSRLDGSELISAKAYGKTGDILYASFINSPKALNIGTDNQVLTVKNGLPSWQNPQEAPYIEISTTADQLSGTLTTDQVSKLKNSNDTYIRLSSTIDSATKTYELRRVATLSNENMNHYTGINGSTSIVLTTNFTNNTWTATFDTLSGGSGLTLNNSEFLTHAATTDDTAYDEWKSKTADSRIQITSQNENSNLMLDNDMVGFSAQIADAEGNATSATYASFNADGSATLFSVSNNTSSMAQLALNSENSGNLEISTSNNFLATGKEISLSSDKASFILGDAIVGSQQGLHINIAGNEAVSPYSGLIITNTGAQIQSTDSSNVSTEFSMTNGASGVMSLAATRGANSKILKISPDAVTINDKAVLTEDDKLTVKTLSYTLDGTQENFNNLFNSMIAMKFIKSLKIEFGYAIGDISIPNVYEYNFTNNTSQTVTYDVTLGTELAFAYGNPSEIAFTNTTTGLNVMFRTDSGLRILLNGQISMGSLIYHMTNWASFSADKLNGIELKIDYLE